MVSAATGKIMGTVSPYDYQQVRSAQILDSLRKYGKALMVMASGTGKTITGAFIAKELMGKSFKALFLCHNNDILNQAKLEYGRVFGDSVNLAVFAGNEKEVGDIIFASFQTMRTWKEAFFHDEFDLVIVDESHHSQADTFRDVIEYFTPKYLLGMTATPDRMDGREIREIFGDEIDPLTLEEAVVQGYVTPITYKLMTVGSLSNAELRRIFQEVMEEGKRISKKQLNETIFIEKRDQEIAKAIITHPGQGIIFCESILHAEEFAKYLPNAEPFHSLQSPSKNAEILKDFRDGKIFYLLTVDKFNEGIDIPDADLVVFLRATDSLTIFLQQLGRGLRKSPGKEKVTVLDFVANVDRLEYVKQMLDRIVALNLEPLEKNPLFVKGWGFDFSITEEIVDILEVLNRIQIPPYETYAEASSAARRLGIRSQPSYRFEYRQDPKLPASPHKLYRTEWQDWGVFLGTGTNRVKNPYETYAQAQAAVLRLKIRTVTQYKKVYRQDPRLPGHPDVCYSSDWNGWRTFCGRDFYETLDQASEAVKKLRIRTVHEYAERYKEDPKLPGCPHRFYKDGWISWANFTGNGRARIKKPRIKKPRVKKPYDTYAEASQATQRLKIQTGKNYYDSYYKDPRLPFDPKKMYAKDWIDWPTFLGKAFYESYTQASKAAQDLRITTLAMYRQRYMEDPHLPSAPSEYYSDSWKGWPEFLGANRKRPRVYVTNPYETYTQASAAVQGLGIKTCTEYIRRRAEDPRLPSNPQRVYAKEWIGLAAFLGLEVREIYPDYAQASAAAQSMGFRGKDQYLKGYKKDPRLPSGPQHAYSGDWIGWLAFLGKYYATYAEASKAAKVLGARTKREYSQLRKTNPRLPSRPEEYYADDWVSWPAFLGKK